MAVNFVARGGIFAALLSCTIKICFEFEKQQTDPYMDEIFHVPQAQNYCHGNYHHWDKKITTLPGLYFSSQAYLKLLSIVVGKTVQDLCGCFSLRITNLFFLMAIYIVVRKIFENQSNNERNQINKRGKVKLTKSVETLNDLRINAASAVLTLFPLLYFFAFLYYTDVGSTFFVLLSYYLSMKKWFAMSAMSGIAAIFFRQTNIVWVGFVCISAIINYLEQCNSYKTCDSLFIQIWRSIVGCLYNFKAILVIAFPYLLVFVGFVVFVIKNNGIVVGDRSSHEASLNLPQMLYFCLFTVCFANFILLKFLNLNYTFQKVRSCVLSPIALITGLLLLVGSFLAVKYFTYVHLYLISDNRHYTFYIWKRIFQAHWMGRYVAVPVYFLSLLLILNELSQKRHSIWIFIFLTCTAAVLIPQKLLEFRYFILPYLLFRLNMRLSTWNELVLEFFTYVGINAATIYLFLTRTFTQNKLEGQRFMW